MSPLSTPIWPVTWLPFDPATLRLLDASAASASSSEGSDASEVEANLDQEAHQVPSPQAKHPRQGKPASTAMSENIIGIRDVYEEIRQTRIELNTRFTTLEQRIDRVESRQDRNDGRLDMVKWLGPSGVVALVFGILKMSGVL